MPRYEYKCRKCEKRFEFQQSMADDPISVCLECGGQMHRLISGGVGIAFKGSGFYVNDSSSSTDDATKAKE